MKNTLNHPDIIGLHGGHDASVALIRNHELVEVMTEERLSRYKKHAGFPFRAISYLKEKYQFENIDSIYLDEVGQFYIGNPEDDVAELQSKFIHKPQYFLRAIFARFAFLQKALSVRDSLIAKKQSKNNQSFFTDELKRVLPGTEVHFSDHHRCHAWAAVPFLPRDGKKRLIITLDGEGQGLCGSINLYENGTLTVLNTFPGSASLGILYSSIVDIMGMKRLEHEFKVMGLAPYAKASSGNRAYEDLKKILWWDEEKMTLCSSIDMHNAAMHLIATEFNIKHRFDSIAYGIQKLCEELVVSIIKSAIKKYKCHDISVGGGIFMNVKANQLILGLSEVHSFEITPSCGDESLAIGAAIEAYAKIHKGNMSQFKRVDNIYLGSEYSDAEVEKALLPYLDSTKYTVRQFNGVGLNSVEFAVAELLSKNEVVGRLKGRAEWGARALGNRSILANASSRETIKLINEMIKGRDFWMPFAASIIYDDRHQYLLNIDRTNASYMAVTFCTTEKAHKELSAALHPYDLTSRPQLVKKEINPDYYALISHFKHLTGVSGILNTSFNLHGEPNVEKPEDALYTFERSGLRHVAVGNFLVSKR